METVESIQAKNAALQFECKKDGLRQTQDGGVKVTFNVNPTDMPKELYTDVMGQRYMCVIVPLNDDETPREKPISHAGDGKALLRSEGFYQYCKYRQWDMSKPLETHMKATVGIKSCKELVEGSDAWERFKAFRKDFYAWKKSHEQEKYYLGS